MPERYQGANRAGLRLAARTVVAPAMRRIARIRTKKTADAVHVVETPQGFEVRAGDPEGQWGWTPIEASMFDNNRRHPLFGNERAWYYQGYFPITEMTYKLALRLGAVDVYVDECLRILLKERGFTD